MNERLASSRRTPRDHGPLSGRGRLLESDLLRVFVTVVLCEGFTSASQVLNRTQAAVSLQIKRLEEIVRAPLLNRSSRRVELTAKGEVLFRYAEKILALNEEAMALLHSDVVAGPVRVGTYHHFAMVELPPVLLGFAALYPDVWIEVHNGLAMAMPSKLGSDFDIVIGLEEELSKGAVALRHESVSWYTSSHHQQHRPLALLPPGSLFRTFAIQSLSERGLSWRIAQVSSSAPAIEAAVANGLAIGVFKDGTPTKDKVTRLGAADGFPDLPDVFVSLQIMAGASMAARQFAEYVTHRISKPQAAPTPQDPKDTAG